MVVLWCLCCVQVEVGIMVEILVVVWVVWYVGVVWVGIGGNDDYVQFGGDVLGVGFLYEVFVGVIEVGQLVKYWQFCVLFDLWWQIDCEYYVVIECCGMVVVVFVLVVEVFLVGKVFEIYWCFLFRNG